MSKEHTEDVPAARSSAAESVFEPALAADTAAPVVAVVLVNWNGWKDCTECLDALLASEYTAFDVFLVDNDSVDGSLDHIAHWCRHPLRDPAWRRLPGAGRVSDRGTAIAFTRHTAPITGPVEAATARPALHLVASGANLGFAGGNNVGMKAAGLDRYAYFWLLNCDTVVAKDALTRLVERAQADRQLGMVGSTLRYYAEPDRVQAMGGAIFDRSSTSIRHAGIGDSVERCAEHAAQIEPRLDYVVGASMLVSREFVRCVGPMQEDYFLYFEEFDWALRGRPQFRPGYAHRSHVFHKVGASSQAVATVGSLRYLYTSRFRFVRRFMADRLPAARLNTLRHALGYARRGRLAVAWAVLGVWWRSFGTGGLKRGASR